MKKLAALVCLLVVVAAPLAAKKKPSASHGKRVFEKHCAQCHLTTSERKVGPGLHGLFHKKKLEDNDKKVNDKNVRQLIENGAGAAEMPPFRGKIKGKDMDALLKYLHKL